MDLRLFPLQTVLFPGMRLPLHIFEERYRLMIRECIEQDAPFGVVLIRSGAEVGGGAMPHQFGTTARITQLSQTGGPLGYAEIRELCESMTSAQEMTK